MAKVTIEFETDDCGARAEVSKIMASSDAHHALRELDEWLRYQIKYASRHDLDEIRDHLHEVCRDRDISLY